jgi:hypothetical protein
MAEAKDCVHVVALNASRKTIVAVLESLDTKTTSTKVFDGVRTIGAFYKECLDFIAQEKDDGFPCVSCALEPLSSEFSFEVWSTNVTLEAIGRATATFPQDVE